MTGHARGVVFGVLGAVVVAGALFLPTPWRHAALGAGAVLLFLAATRVGLAGRAVDALSPFRDAPVHVAVWGRTLPGASAEGMQLESVRAVGAGLLLTLRSRADGSRAVLKVAQPRGIEIGDAGGRAEIRDARFVQWQRERLPAAADAPAVVLQRLIADAYASDRLPAGEATRTV